MIKTCKLCSKEYETPYPNKVYCSKECYSESASRRKRKEREITKKRQTKEAIEARRQRKAEIDKVAKEQRAEQEADLQKRLKERDPKAIMEITNHFDLEYWEAYKEEFMQDDNKNYIRYVNEINIYDDDFPSKVINSIKEKGSIYSNLVRNKK